MTPTKLLIGQIIVVFAIVIAGLWAATQWAAAMLAYQPQLGLPWFTLFHTPIYRPWAIFPWWYHYDAYAPQVSDAARVRWIEFSDFCEREMGPNGRYAEIGDFASKAPENATRLAAVMSYFERTAQALDADGISENALRAGIQLAQYYAEEAIRLFNASSVDAESDDAQELIDWIRKKGFARVGKRYLNRLGPKRVRSAKALDGALNMLVEYHHLLPIKGGAHVQHAGEPETYYRDAYVVVPTGEK